MSERADAGPHEGGVLVVHASPSLTYTDSHDFCGESDLDECADAVVSVEADPGIVTVFHALAVFPDAASPQLTGVTFGVEWDAGNFFLLAMSSCADFELATETWPATGEGVGLTWHEPQSSHLVELYWFAGYAHDEETETSFALGPHPVHGGRFADSAVPATLDEVADYGSLGFGEEGHLACTEEGGWSSQSSSGGGWYAGETSLPDLMFVELGTTEDSTFVSEMREIRRTYGLQVLVAITPDGLFCRADELQAVALEADERVVLVTGAPIPDTPPLTDTDLSSGDPQFARRLWNARFTSEAPDTISGDFIWSSEACIDSVAPSVELTQPDNHTADFMIGDVFVSVICPESTDEGPCEAPDFTENWTGAELNVVADQVGLGLSYLATLLQPGVTFIIGGTIVVPTPVEPVQTGDQSEWLDPVLDELGVPEVTSGSRMGWWNTQRRSQRESDWAITGLFVRSECDTNHAFPGPGYSYANRTGGCYATCLSRNGDQWTMSHLYKIVRHEFAHVFGALDEYREDGPCNQLGGYLQVENGNAIACDPDPQHACWMRDGDSSEICAFSLGQMGILDTDADGFLDPLDHPEATHSMLLGDGDPVQLGDIVDIYQLNTWHKRLPGSNSGMDRGAVMWDGINQQGNRWLPNATYTWKRNGGSPHTATMSENLEDPEILDFQITDAGDSISLRFTDSDTHAGRVRLEIAPLVGGIAGSVPVWDELFLESEGAQDVITETDLSLNSSGEYRITVTVWDFGARASARDTIEWHGPAAAVQTEVNGPANELRISGWPLPSESGVDWSLEGLVQGELSLGIVSVDGRRVRSWAAREWSCGEDRLRWDGKDQGGRRVPSGRYYLVVTNAAGRSWSAPAIIVR